MANGTIPSYRECRLKTDLFTQLPKDSTHSSRVSLSSFTVVNGLAALPTFLVNLLVMWTVLESHRLRSSSYNILVAVLSLSDMLTGLLVQPLFISFSACYLSNCSFFCELKDAFSLASVLNSRWILVILTTICVERYLYIIHPLTYSTKVTIQKTLYAVVVGWLVAAVGVAVQKIEHKHAFLVRKLIGFTFHVPIISIIVFCSIKMHLTVRRQRKSVATAGLTQGSQQSKLKEFKRIDAIQIALLVFALQYAPLLISQVFWTFKGQSFASNIRIINDSFSVTCVYLKSLINPFLYSIRLGDIRKGVRSKLPGFKENLNVAP